MMREQKDSDEDISTIMVVTCIAISHKAVVINTIETFN